MEHIEIQRGIPDSDFVFDNNAPLPMRRDRAFYNRRNKRLKAKAHRRQQARRR